MANLNFNFKNISQNISQKNLFLTGMCSIIDKHSNITMYNGNISGSIIADQSNLIIGDNINFFVLSKSNAIYATNNSKISSTNNILVNSNNNSVYNFNHPVLCLIKSYYYNLTKDESGNFSNISLNTVDKSITTVLIKTLHQDQTKKYLSNDVYTYKINSSVITNAIQISWKNTSILNELYNNDLTTLYIELYSYQLNNDVLNFNIPPIAFSKQAFVQSDILDQNSNEIRGNLLGNYKYWNPYLVNDGNKFLWYKSNNLNNYYITNNRKNDYIISQSDYLKLNTILENLPKNLYGKTLQIKIQSYSGKNKTNKKNLNNDYNWVKITNFYNGTVKVYANGLSECVLQCINIEKLIITTELESSTIDRSNIRIENVQNCTIDNIKFQSEVNNNMTKTIDNINEIYTYNQWIQKNQQKLDADIISLENDTYEILQIKKNSFFQIYIKQSHVTLKNCVMEDNKQTIIYCTLNSKLTAYNNKFSYNQTYTNNFIFSRRPIIYYISKNSFCVATNDVVELKYKTGISESTIEFTGNQNDFIQQQYKHSQNTVKFSYLYGYTYPGSFFNHYHKAKLLKQSQLINRDLISKKQLPIGSMYQIPVSIIKNKNLDGNNYIYDLSSTIGYHIASGSTAYISAYIGVSYEDGYFHYNTYNTEANLTKRENKSYEAMKRQLSKFNDINQFATNVIYPQLKSQKRYKSEYADNIKYAQIIRHHFNLSACPYFNKNLLSSTNEYNSLIVSVPSALCYATAGNDNHVLAIQYSQFVNYDKTIFSTNIQKK